jgi:glycosyltransferase involved in cell wall biosynthesis
MSAFNNPDASTAQPLVTIAIPTRNRAALLRDCANSAFAQTYSNIEVLVSDNASTDNTLAVLESFDDPRLRVLTNGKNIGLVGNWNRCVREASGEYFVILSDDNTLEPTFVEKCVELLRKEPGLPIVAGSYDIVITAENRTVPAVLSKRLHTGIWEGTEILNEHLRGNFACMTLSVAIRTDILRRNGGFYPEHVDAGEELVWGQVFLEGRAGLINERCSSYLFHTHPTARYSASIDVDSQFKDLCAVMGELSKAAGRMVSNEAACREVQRLTRRYVAHRAIQELAFLRREGASLLDVVARLWGWRGLLAGCTPIDFVAASRLRLIGRILSPTPMIKLFRSMAVFGSANASAHRC